MWLLVFFLLTNSIGLAALFAALVLWRRESGSSPIWLASRRGLGTLFVLAAGAGLIVGGSYRLVHWITAWRLGHKAQLAVNPWLYDTPVLPEGLDFLSARMAVITASCLALLAVGVALWILVRPADGSRGAHGKGPLAWSLAAALIITLAELSVFQYYNQLTIGIKGLAIQKTEASPINEKLKYNKDYKFRSGTEHFFAQHVASWEKALENFKGKTDVQYLEIGMFEGQSALWMLENVLTDPTARLTGIDPFFESYIQMESYKDVFYSNLKLSGLEEKANIIKGFSQIELRKLPLDSFDIIYIDGSHDAADCHEDAVLAWRLLKNGGILIFDDYLYNANAFVAVDKPKIAIDTFLGLFGNHFDVIHSDWQLILKKRGNSVSPPADPAR